MDTLTEQLAETLHEKFGAARSPIEAFLAKQYPELSPPEVERIVQRVYALNRDRLPSRRAQSSIVGERVGSGHFIDHIS